MTTLRRLLVAVYPIRLFLLALAAWSVAADVCAQSPIRVGYYDMVAGAGSAEQAAPITAAGFTPVLVDNFTAGQLATLHVLFVQNPSPNVYGQEYLDGRPLIEAAVRAGMVLIIHDRTVSNMTTGARVGQILPGVTVPNSVSAMKTTTASLFNNIDVTDATTLITGGPFGTIASSGLTSLDFGFQSNHGTVNLSMSPNIPQPRRGLFHTGASGLTQSVALTYQLQAGHVIYSTMPLDMFLRDVFVNGGGPVLPRDNFTNIYAPNLLTYAACVLRALPPPTVSVSPVSSHYGGSITLTATVKCGVIPVPGVTVNFSLNGAAAGSAQTDASGTATRVVASSPESAIAVGSYPAGVAAAFAGTAQYSASSGTASLTVNKAPSSISFDAVTLGTFVYNAQPHAASGSVRGVFGESLGAPSFSYTDEHGVTSVVAPVNVGTYRVTASAPESANYLGTTAESDPKIKITPAPLVVTAHDKTKLYGAAVPALTATYQGFVGDENEGVLSGALQITTSATAASSVGEYRITPSGVTSSNYDIAFVEGTLAVTPAVLAVRTADANKIYGAELPAFIAVYEGFVLGETVEALSGSLHFVTEATRSSAVGAYDVTPSGLNSHNYAIQFVAGTLTVSPAPLSIRADDKTKVYGAALPAFTALYEGFVLGETPGTLAGTLAFQTNATMGSHVGRYPITPSGLTSRNYNIGFADGSLVVTPAPLTIRANDKERLVGKMNPLLTVSYDGFVLNDTEGILDVGPSVATTATVSSPVGSYPIVAAGASDSDYSIDYVNGELTVSPEGRVHGSGFVDAEGARHHFVFDARETIVLGEKGSLSLRVERVTGSDVFVSQLVTSVVFTNNFGIDPGGKAVVDGVALIGIGTWNGIAATFEVLALDKGEPGVGNDTITLRIKVAGLVVNTTQGALNGGNIQSNRVK